MRIPNSTHGNWRDFIYFKTREYNKSTEVTEMRMGMKSVCIDAEGEIISKDNSSLISCFFLGFFFYFLKLVLTCMPTSRIVEWRLSRIVFFLRSLAHLQGNAPPWSGRCFPFSARPICVKCWYWITPIVTIKNYGFAKTNQITKNI